MSFPFRTVLSISQSLPQQCLYCNTLRALNLISCDDCGHNALFTAISVYEKYFSLLGAIIFLYFSMVITNGSVGNFYSTWWDWDGGTQYCRTKQFANLTVNLIPEVVGPHEEWALKSQTAALVAEVPYMAILIYFCWNLCTATIFVSFGTFFFSDRLIL